VKIVEHSWSHTEPGHRAARMTVYLEDWEWDTLEAWARQKTGEGTSVQPDVIQMMLGALASVLAGHLRFRVSLEEVPYADRGQRDRTGGPSVPC
jgi:hypothetical protein